MAVKPNSRSHVLTDIKLIQTKTLLQLRIVACSMAYQVVNSYNL